jgi:hypothetical protein
MTSTMDLDIACDGLTILRNHQEFVPLDELTYQPLINVGG